jgi:hypothetical protein
MWPWSAAFQLEKDAKRSGLAEAKGPSYIAQAPAIINYRIAKNEQISSRFSRRPSNRQTSPAKASVAPSERIGNPLIDRA